MDRRDLNVLESRGRYPCILIATSFGEFSAASTAAAIVTAATVGLDRREYEWREKVEDWAAAGQAGTDDPDVGFNDRPHGGGDVV